MKKIYCLFFLLLLSACSQNQTLSTLTNISLQGQLDSTKELINQVAIKSDNSQDLITSSQEIEKIPKINDFYVLQAKDYTGSKIYFLAKDYEINEVELWNAAPTGIEQKGQFFLYKGDLAELNETNAYKIGDFIFSGTKNYFEIKSLASADFAVIEQYAMNNFSRFYFWQIKNDKFAPVKFDGGESVLSGWTYDSIKFKDNYITCYGYWGGQPFDYKETYKDLYWDGSNFELIMRWTIMNDDQNKYSFYIGEDKANPSWEFTWQFDSTLIDYFVTPNRKNIVTIETVPGGWYMSVHNIKTGREEMIAAEPEAVFQINKDKSNDNLIFYVFQGVEVPPVDFQYDLAKKRNIQLSEPWDQESLKSRY